MGKYHPLRDYLTEQHTNELVLTFREIETIIGDKLPKSADRPQFWANVKSDDYGHTQRETWRKAGYDAFLVAGHNRVRFVRVS
jgi:hypothetical protein